MASMSRYDGFFDQLAERLGEQGFSIARNVISGNDRYELLAYRNDSLPLGGRRTRYIIATSMDAVDGKIVREYSKRAFKFGLAHRKSFFREALGLGRGSFPRGLEGGLQFFPVIVSDEITDELKAWLNKSMPEIHFVDSLEFPVLISPKERKTYFFGQPPPIGWSFYKGFVKFIDQELGFN
jgi:hypothetical protein